MPLISNSYLLTTPVGRDFTRVQTGPGFNPSSCKMGTGSFPGVKCGRGVTLTTHPPSSAELVEDWKISYSLI